MVEQQVEIKKPSALRKEFSESETGYPMESYLDVKKYNEEQDLLRKIGESSARNVRYFFKPTDKESEEQWNESAQYPLDLFSCTNNLIESIVDKSLGGTVLGTDISSTLITAKDFLTKKGMDKQMNLAKKNHFSQDMFKKHVDYTNFNSIGGIFMKIGDISMIDILERSNISPAEYYNCEINSWFIKYKLIHKKILDENKNDSTNLYPNTSKQLLHNGAGQILGVSNLDHKLASRILNCFPTNDKLIVEIVKEAEDIVKKTDSLEQKVFDTIFDPTSPFFSALKERFETYIGNEDPLVRMLAVQKLGLKTEDRIIKGYRAAKRCAIDNPEHRVFYEEFANFIENPYVGEAQQMFSFLTHDDTVMFINENVDYKNKPVPTLENLKNIKMEILQKSSKPEYLINPDGIPWQGLIQPTAVTVKFDKDFPNKTNFIFHYENLEGEKNDLSFKINSKNAEFDWNFLESPDDSRMTEMKSDTLLSIQSVLTETKKQAEVEYQERLKSRRIITPASSIHKKPKSEEVWTPREKETKPKAPKAISPTQGWQNEILPQKGKKEIKRHITYIVTDRIAKQLEKFDSGAPERIIRSIEKFNQDGKGAGFKHLNIKLGKKPIDELVIGEYRVLLVTDDSSEDKIQNFKAIEVGKRKDIYSNRHKQTFDR